MDVEWDEAKRLSNLAERGVDFAGAALIFAATVIEAEDSREDYGERRFRALGQVECQYYLSAWRIDSVSERRYSALLARGT